jgi:His/Glu/Gln/Arg/opine family amino acid ABC transporter permease subunit
LRFDPAYTLSAIPALLEAGWLTVRLAFAIMLLGLLGGTLLTVLRVLKWAPLSAAIAVLMSAVRGTPLLIQIFVFYYVLPSFGIDMGPVTAGVLAVGLNSAVFVTEILRGGLASIDQGEIEAAVSLGLKPKAIWLKIVLPQLFLRTLPNLVNEYTIVVKATALLSVITVVELFRTSVQIYSANFHTFETLVAAAIIYIAINVTASGFGRLIEARTEVRRP